MPKQENLLLDEKENAGIAALCRGFLTKYSDKRSVLAREVNKAAVPSLDLEASLDAFDSANCVFPRAKGSQTEIPFAGGAEARARGADDIGFVQQFVEEAPGINACRSF